MNVSKSIFNNLIIKTVLLLGVFSTMPIISFPIAGRELSVFTIILFFYLIISLMALFSSRILIIDENQKLLISILLLSLISAVAGFLYFGFISADLWQKASITPIPKIIMYFVICITWPKDEKICKSFIQGLLIGCVINVIWSIIDAAGFYTLGISINNTIFQGYAIRNNIHFNSISIAYSGGLIRASGFNPDPAAMGFITPLVIGYSMYRKNYILLAMGLLSIISSASTTGFVSSLMIIIVALFRMTLDRRRQLKNIEKNKKSNTNGKIILLLFSIITILVLICFRDKIFVLLSKGGEFAFDRFFNGYGSTSEDNIRLAYMLYFPLAITTAPFNIIIGTGWGTSSYAYAFNHNISSKMNTRLNFAYDPENTYIDTFLDIGIIGVFLFYLLFRRLIKYYKTKLEDGFQYPVIYFSLFAMLFSGIFYHYVLYAPEYLIIICSLNNINSKSEQLFIDENLEINNEDKLND